MRQLSDEEIERVVAGVPLSTGQTEPFQAALARGNHLEAVNCVPRRFCDPREGGSKWTYQPMRLTFLAEVSEFLNEKEFAEVLRVVWTTSEKFVDETMFRTLYDWSRKGTALLGLTAAEQKFLASLPDRFPIYRGCTESTRDGYCWTTEHTVAHRFAATHHAENGEPEEVLKCICRKSVVRAIYLNAHEFEVIVDYKDLIEPDV